MKEYIFEIHYCNCSIKKDDIVRITTPDSVSEDKTVEACSVRNWGIATRP